jgi:uncharacterized protein
VEVDKGREMSLVYGYPEGLGENPTCFVIAHGAGGPMYSPFITYFHTELAKKGFLTVKFNFPYMEARKRIPDRSDVLKTSYVKIVDGVRSSRFKPGRVFVGGKSMGGRIASMAVSDGLKVDGLFFLGYPLHSPGKLEQLRDEHLYRISKPMIFVSGTKDAFGTKHLLERVIAKLGSKARVHWVQDGDHSFKTSLGREGLANTYQEVVTLLTSWASEVESQ